MNLNTLIKQKEKEICKIIDKHGCRSCWSDDHNCTCNDEQDAMMTLVSLISDAIKAGYEQGIREVLAELKSLILSKESLKIGENTIQLNFNDGVNNCINVIENTYQSLLKKENLK